jgi:hypothetical protein
MIRSPWRKFQDFYLRLGFLKALVAVLDPHRRPSPPDVLADGLCRHLFLSAASNPSVVERLRGLPFDLDEERKKGKERRSAPTLAEALLLLGDCPSNLYAITPKSAIKVVEWGRDYGLLGHGNQITDRGLVLKSLLPSEKVTRFLRGDVLAWNPFVLSPEEKAFFLYQLCEIDAVTVAILDELGKTPPGTVVEAAMAGVRTCRALFEVLDSVHDRTMLTAQPQLRVSRELACAMARELDLKDLVARCGSLTQRGPARVTKIRPTGTLAPAKMEGAARRTTKNTDHQAIPRFEQLVDLGMLVKPGSEHPSAVERYHARSSWRYQTTERTTRWAESRALADRSRGWEQARFAATAASSLLRSTEPRRLSGRPEELAEFLWAAWMEIHQPIGHTPLETIALLATIEALGKGRIAEISDFHGLMIALKRTGIAGDLVFFAGGNRVPDMFVHLRNGFVEAVRSNSASLAAQSELLPANTEDT